MQIYNIFVVTCVHLLTTPPNLNRKKEDLATRRTNQLTNSITLKHRNSQRKHDQQYHLITCRLAWCRKNNSPLRKIGKSGNFVLNQSSNKADGFDRNPANTLKRVAVVLRFYIKESSHLFHIKLGIIFIFPQPFIQLTWKLIIKQAI